MLILTRRPGESFHIGDDIVVTILSVRGDQIRFGFIAPRSIDIHREEIWKRIQEALFSPTQPE
jgi:carbon storage regulator